MILPCEIPQLDIPDVGRYHRYHICHIFHMTPIALPQYRAGAGPTSPRFPVLGTGIV